MLGDQGAVDMRHGYQKNVEIKSVGKGQLRLMAAWILAACAGLAWAGAAVAEPSDVKAGGTAAGETQKDVLGGPKVNEESKPGAAGKFTNRDNKNEVSQAMVMRVMKKLASEETAEDVRLSADQIKQIEALDKELKDLITAYREKNRQEVMRLRELLPTSERRRVDAMLGRPEGRREGRREGGREGREGRGPVGPEGVLEERGAEGDLMGDLMADAPKPEEVDAARARLKEIGAAVPKPADTQAKMYLVLNEAQKQTAVKEMETAREEMRKRAEERRKGRGGESGKDVAGKDVAGKDGAGKDGEGRRMSPEMRERLEKLNPEDQEKIRAMSPEERRAKMKELMSEPK